MYGNKLILDFFMEIKKNMSRFLSIVLIVALGVAFFSGVRAAKPDMLLTAEKMYDEQKLMDLRVVSSLGLTAEDAQAIQELEGVEAVAGVYTTDVLCEGTDSSLVLRLRSNTPGMNEIVVTQGRMPERESECLVDDVLAKKMNVQLGDIITVAGGTKEVISDTLRTTSFIVTGFGNSPMYLWRDRGSSTIGTGMVDGFLIVQPEVFCTDVYSEVDVMVADARGLDSYKKAYQKKIDQVVDRIENIQLEHATARYNVFSEKAQSELVDAQSKLDAAKAELDESKKRLDTAQAELDAAKNEIQQKLHEILSGQTTIEEQERLLQESTSQLEAMRQALDLNKADLMERQAVIEAGQSQIAASQQQLVQSWAQWSQQSAQLQTQQEELVKEEEQLQQKKARLDELYLQLQQTQEVAAVSAYSLEFLDSERANGEKITKTASRTTENSEESPSENQDDTLNQDNTDQPPVTPDDQNPLQQEIAQLESEISEKESEIAEKKANYEEADAQLNATWTELDNLGRQLETQAAAYDSAQSELSMVMAQFALGEADYMQKKATLDASLQTLAVAKEAIANGQTSINASQTQIAGAESELAKGRQEYEKNYKESQQRFKDATEELNAKRRQLLRMEVPEWNVLDRDYIASCNAFAQDADRIGAIGNVFPLIFFLVAALVSLTTITRMVEEQRTQIGTFKALGYENRDIAAKYIGYALLASVIGGVFGLLLGQAILPRVIIQTYRMLYVALPATKAPLHFWYSISSVTAAVCCTGLAAFAACYRQLRAVPAQLMRPEAPKIGKKVFLEKYDAIWGKLNFSQKAAVRNMIRYKKRFFMTLFGIAACTALLLVGFGLKNSIMAIGEKQFGELQKFDAELVLKTTDLAPVEALTNALSEDEQISDYTFVYQTAMEAGCGKKEESAYVTVVKDAESFHKFQTLQKRGSKKEIAIPEDGVILTEKLSRLLGVKKGDTIYLMDSDNYKTEVKVAAVVENYFRHYVYMSEAQYAALYGGAPDYNEIMTIHSKMDEKAEHAMGEKYLQQEAVGSIVFHSNTEKAIRDILKSMDLIVIVLIVAAALLAFVVLYNLNTINITERRRELASLKVLGFYDEEVTMYVFRENVIITVLGLILGLILGIGLHRFVILTAELDLMMFGRVIRFSSYLFSIIFTCIFSAGINWLMHKRLQKIDMVESLKSVE